MRIGFFMISFQAANVTVLDTREDKLNWIFMAFDKDGGGFIDVHEIKDIVTCLFRYSTDNHFEIKIFQFFDLYFEKPNSLYQVFKNG